MTVVITGSSGILGRGLVNYFSEKKIRVVCLVRNESFRIASGYVHTVNYSNHLNEEGIISEIKKYSPDVFIHCAWKGTHGEARNEPGQLVYNIPLTIESVLLAHAVSCKTWIGIGSQAEYGIKTRPVSESDSCDPQSMYGKAKLISGNLALDLCRHLNMKGIWNRVFSLYGPHDYENYFIPYVINSLKGKQKPALTKCEQQWDYLYVEDAARAIDSQILKSCEGIYNICSGSHHSLKKIVEVIQLLLQDQTTISFGAVPYAEKQVMFLSGNCDKLKRQTGWNPEFNLEQGLNKTIKYYLEHESI